MDLSGSIPIPVTLEDEEEQLELAILQSLQEVQLAVQQLPGNLTDPDEDLGYCRSNRMAYGGINARANSCEDGAANVASSSNVNCGRIYKSVPVLYRRSQTMPNCVTAHPNSETLSVPTLTLNLMRARSANYSPPCLTYSTDCCEVRDEILSGNDDYITNLKEKLDGSINPPIHIAVKKEHFHCVDAIIGKLPETITQRDTNGETPLFVAASEGSIRMARRLIAAGADVNTGKRNRDTPLLAAIENESVNLVRLLLKNGANPNLGMNRGWTAVHECTYRGNTDLLELVLSFGGNPDVRDTFGVSPVFSSAACGMNECLEILLRSGGDPNLSALSRAASPLYEACKNTHVDCALTLLNHGANPNVPNCENLYPLHMACQKGSTELVEVLIEITDRTLVQNCGVSPIHCAAEHNEIVILQLLIDQGYDVNIKIAKDKITYRDCRQTALFFAVFNDSEEAVEILLEAGAHTELDYVKPLFVAESHRQYEIVNMLIDNGADVNASFAGEGAVFPATAAFAIKDPIMFKKILLAGCDVSRCFKCPIGERDHQGRPNEDQKKPFCYFISQDENVEWAGWTVTRLLEFVGSVQLCRGMRDILVDTKEWGEIERIIERPRSLAHLCRLKIRESARKREFKRSDLPLPKPLLNYMNYSYF